MVPIKSVTPVRQIIKAFAIASYFAILLSSQPVYALEVNVATMIQNLSNDIPQLMKLTTAIGYVLGMAFIVGGIVKLKHFGEGRTGGHGQGSLKGPITFMAVGTALMYLPTSIQAGLSTFWSEPTPYAYVTQATDQWSQLTNSIYMIVQLVGVIAFIRGLVLLTHTGEGQQHGTMGRAIAHIVGGILCINMYQFLQAVFNTLALGQ